MALEQSTSSLDTAMAKNNAINSVVQNGKNGLSQLKSGISSTIAKVGLVSLLTLGGPKIFAQTGNDVAKNANKPKVENPIPTVKKDTAEVKNEVPQWRKDLDTAIANSVQFVQKNFDDYLKDFAKLDADSASKLGSRQQYISGYAKTIVNLIKILEVEKRQFNETEQKAIKGIQQKLIFWSNEGLHPYLDKFAYYTLQEINVFVATFEQPLIVKNQ